jgi:hypothetical protein
MPKHLLSCDCGNVMECIEEEDEVIKPKYGTISGNLRLRCNDDCGKEHEIFLRHKIAKFVRASPSFKEIFHHPDNQQLTSNMN